MTGTNTIAEHVDSILSSTRTLAALISSTLSGSTGLGIHQIDICYTQVRQIGLKGTTPVVHTVILISLVRYQLLTEVTGTATIGRTGRITCWNHVTTGKHLQELERLVIS